MPMVWNTEAEHKLLAAIFQVCEIKVTQPQMQAIAAIMGPDCTPKAITHRISKFKTAAKNDDGDTEPTKKTPKPKPAARKRKAKTPESEQDDGLLSPPASSRKKQKIKMENREDDGLSDGKYIQTGEDIGQGFRAASKTGLLDEDSD